MNDRVLRNVVVGLGRKVDGTVRRRPFCNYCCVRNYGNSLSCNKLCRFKRCHPCKNGQDFIEEANQIYERELFLRAMRNQMKQLRKIVGEQYIRAGNTLGDFFQGKVSLTADNKKLYEKITKGFAKSQLRLKEIYFYDNPEKGKQIYLYLKKKKGREISTRQAAVLLSSMTMEKMKPLPDQKKDDRKLL